jgi:hypothetical protein
MTQNSVLPASDATAAMDPDVPGRLPSCMLATEALAAFNEHAAARFEKPWSMKTFVSRVQAHDRGDQIPGHWAFGPSGELVSETRWRVAPDPRVRPVPPRGMLLAGQRVRGLDRREFPGPHEEFIVALDVLRDAVAEIAWADGGDGQTSEAEIYGLTWSCLSVLSHPPQWYPAPSVSAEDNMLAVCERAAGMIIAEIQGRPHGAAPDAAWSARAWLHEAAVPDPAGTPAGQLYRAYTAWCAARQYAPAPVQGWGRALTDAGYPSVPRREGKYRALRPVA